MTWEKVVKLRFFYTGEGTVRWNYFKTMLFYYFYNDSIHQSPLCHRFNQMQLISFSIYFYIFHSLAFYITTNQQLIQ